MIVNFFWTGDDFQFLNRLTIASHILVGHEVRMWLKGNRPNSKYWIDDFPEVEILDASTIFNGTQYEDKTSRDARIYSDVWSFYLIKQTGEYYADTDAIALKHWPDDEMILATYGEGVINIGVMRLPKNHPVLDCSIKRHKHTWGAVKRFSRCCEEHNLKPTVPDWMFYPILLGVHNDSKVMKCKGRILDPIDDELQKKIDNDCVSIHYWSNKVSNVGITHEWLAKPELKESLFCWLERWVGLEYSNWTLVNEIHSNNTNK